MLHVRLIYQPVVYWEVNHNCSILGKQEGNGTHLFILNNRAPLLFTIKLMKPDSLASIMNWSKNLYVFMLGALIVFSGCVGTGTTDGEGDDDAVGTTVINNNYNQSNQLPVIYSQISRSGTFEIFLNVMAQDYDGNITEFGLDLNLDGTIDMQINSYPYNLVRMNYTDNWSNPLLYNPENSTEPGNMQCMEWIQLIATDDDGGTQYRPIGIFSFYGDENNDGTYECTNWIQTIG